MKIEEENGKKHYLSDMYLTNEAVKLIPNNEKLNNVNQSEAPLLEKKLNIDDNDLYEVKQPKPRQHHKARLFFVLVGTAVALILTGSVIMALYMSRGARRIPICSVGDGYPLKEIRFPYMPEDDYKYSKMSDSNLFGRRNYVNTEKSNKVSHETEAPPPLPILPKMPGPVIIKTEDIEDTAVTTEDPLIERNLDDNCEDGMTSYSIGPNIKICAMHKEVKVEEMGWAVEDCKDIKGHLPEVGNPDELKYIGGLLKDMSRMTRKAHLSPILVKREVNEEDFDAKDSLGMMSKGWSFYQAMNQSQNREDAEPNSVGILCIRPLDQKDLGFFWKVEADMINMMKKFRERVSSAFSSSKIFGNE